MSSPAYGYSYNGLIYPCDYVWDTQNMAPTQNRLAELNLQDHIFIPQDSGQILDLNSMSKAPSSVQDLMTFWKIIFGKIQGNSEDFFAGLNGSSPSEKIEAFSAWCMVNQEQLKQIVTLDLQGQNLWSLPKEIGFLTGLEMLTLDKNKLTKLPIEIGYLENLKMLHISYNPGLEIPDSMSSLKKLEMLSLMHNKLEEMPEAICSMPMLKLLNLSNNFIKKIPPQIEGLKSLEMLDLDNNDIEGLPSEIHKLSSLECLYLENNEIKTLPHEMCNMPILNQLKLQKNRLAPNDATVMKLTDNKVDVYI